MFPVYSGKCLSRLFGPLKIQLSGKRFTDEEVETEMLKWAETTVKIIICCRFRRTNKVLGQMLVQDILRNKCFFFRYEYYIFYALNPFVTYLLTLPRIIMNDA
jgi:hypothetical protein